MTEAIAHRARTSVFQQEATWRLAPDALMREGGEASHAPFWARLARIVVKAMVPFALDPIERGGAARFPYAEISNLRLSFEPTRLDTRRHRCEFKLANGTKAFFVSTHYESVATFEDRAATYVPLVRGLVARIAAENPACKFRSGKRPWSYWFEHIFLLAMFALLITVLFLFGGAGLSDFSYAKLALVISFIPVMLLYTRKNWPRRFAPPAIPGDVLPDV